MPAVKSKNKRRTSTSRSLTAGVDRSAPKQANKRSVTKTRKPKPGKSNSATKKGANAKAVLSRQPDYELGRGRSGIVFRSVDESNRVIARKVFGSSGLAKVVQYTFLGAPNPYAWNEAAIRTAVLRRRVLSELTAYWFDGKLRVAKAYDHGWNERFRAYEMRCELIQGRHVALQHSTASVEPDELKDLTNNIMKPLQSHLIEAGLDGMVWQAGKGNPVALNNFMLEQSSTKGDLTWVWIDLESGVPALIPMNPLTLLSFYLPKSIKHSRPLFDDLDLDKLRAYIIQHGSDLLDKLGCDRMRQLGADIGELTKEQTAWKAVSRLDSSIGYQRAKGAISGVEADWYAGHAVEWYSREAKRAIRSIPSVVAESVMCMAVMFAGIKVWPVLKSCWSALRSQAYRERVAKDYMVARLDKWSHRGQLDKLRSAQLRDHIETEEAGSYITDFGVHLAVKPFVKLLQFWVLPALWVAGVVDELFVVAFFVAGGSIVRTIYTLGRLIQNALTGREKPWVALGVGVLPIVGNIAFPLQIIATGANGHRAVAQFILFDSFSRLGNWFPIWGGSDTWTEHAFNRLPNLFFRSPNRDTSAASDNYDANSRDADSTLVL